MYVECLVSPGKESKIEINIRIINNALFIKWKVIITRGLLLVFV